LVSASTSIITSPVVVHAGEASVDDAREATHRRSTCPRPNPAPPRPPPRGGGRPTGGGSTYLGNLIEKANPGRADLITLVVVLGAIEDSTGTHTWRNPGGIAGAYFKALATWGYTLSDVEKIAAGITD
jgi:hypothetical protein